MSVNVYLREEIRQAEGFGMKTKIWGKPPQNYEQATFMGIELSMSEGRLSLHLGYLDGKIPEVLLLFVSDVSFHDCFPLQPRRETGVYRDDKFGDAIAKLEVNSSNYFLRITGTKLEEGKKLDEAIRAGTVRPTESGEQSQQGQSRDELEAELAESRRAVEDLDSRYGTAIAQREQALEQLSAVRKFANVLARDAGWRICLKSTVSGSLLQIL